MRVYGWSVFAITLLVFGHPPDSASDGRSLRHVEVLPLMSPDACAQTVELARQYLVPVIPGGERVAYVCHSALREAELRAMQRRAATENAARAGAGTAAP